jgi:putative ABC transport system permease protein
MKLKKGLKLALNILIHAKLRSWLTIIGIVIGVAAVVGIVSIGEGAQASVQASLGGLGADLISVSPGFSRARGGFGGGDHPGEGGGGTSSTTTKNLTTRDVQIIKTIEGVKFVNGIVSGRVDVSYLAETASLSVQGVDPFAWVNIQTSELASGRLLNPSDKYVIVIGNRIATNTFKQPLALNRMIMIEGKPFKIVGILKAAGEGMGGGDNTIAMPIEAAREILGKPTNAIDSISIKVSDISLVEQVTNETTRRLQMSRHVSGRTQDFSVTSAQAMQARITSTLQTFTIFLAAIAAVSLLVGAVGIANTMFTSVLEKTREIGIMKAIGAKNSDILIIFIINSGLVGLVGGIIGVIFGAVISYILPNLLSRATTGGGFLRGGLTSALPVSLLVEALTLSVLIGIVAGAIPAYRASKLKPVDALRYD